jgi:hypothetical protein
MAQVTNTKGQVQCQIKMMFRQVTNTKGQVQCQIKMMFRQVTNTKGQVPECTAIHTLANDGTTMAWSYRRQLNDPYTPSLT